MKKTRLTQEDVLNKTEGAFEQLESHRVEELEKAKRLQEINHDAALRERERLSRKYGADHPRVQKIAARTAYNAELFQGLDREIERSRIKTPPFAANAWRVHGRVFDPKNAPLQGMTVFLANREQQWLRHLGFACTDERGYYGLDLDDKALEQHKNEPLFLAVSDKKNRLVYVAPKPTIASAGNIEYRDIFLTEEACQMPPDKEKREEGEQDLPVVKGRKKK